MKGSVPYWGAGGVLDFVDQEIFNEPLVLLKEDGSPFFIPGKGVAYYVEGPTWVNNHIHALRATGTDGPFLAYALNCVDYSNYLTGSTRDKLTQEDLKKIDIWQPPLQEQRHIADFLDAETTRIDALATARARQVQLLQERRVACLTACVSAHGSDTYRHPLAGRISSQWPVVQLRRVLPAVNVGVVINPSTYFTDAGVPFIHGFNVRAGWINPTGIKFISNSSNIELNRSRVYSGDVLVVRAGAPGRSAVVTEEFNGANCASVLILRKSEQVLPEFLSAFINSPAGRGQVQISQYGAAQEVISAAQTLAFQIPVPDLPEQQVRVEQLNRSLATLDLMEQKLEHQSYLLAERRQALITAAVTGQFDVSTASGRNVTDGVHA